jgi:hypothetical protein
MEAFLQAAAEFVVMDLELEAEPSAMAAAQRSLDESGLLLLGEVHGVRTQPGRVVVICIQCVKASRDSDRRWRGAARAINPDVSLARQVPLIIVRITSVRM